MPRFFFPIRDSEEFSDEKGIELPDLPAARAHAATLLQRLLSRDARLWDSDSEWRLEVLDEAGIRLLTLVVVASQAYDPQ